MSTIKNFEDLIVWQKSRALSRSIYQLTSHRNFAKDFGLHDQIRRASVSIPSNIAEGFERDGNRELKQFLAIAKGSAGEVRAQLYVALDAEYITEQEFNRVHRDAVEVARLIDGFLRYLGEAEQRGRKWNR